MKDPGLQPERTSLAWSRTALSMLVTAAVWLKMGAESHRLESVVTGLFLLAGAFFAWGIGLLRRDELLSMAAAKAPSGYLMAAMAVGVLACAGGSVALFLI